MYGHVLVHVLVQHSCRSWWGTVERQRCEWVDDDMVMAGRLLLMTKDHHEFDEADNGAGKPQHISCIAAL